MVKIDSGALQGTFGYDPRITVFKGVPYAAPPVGDLRWRAPQPVKAWDGVRFATEYADISIQKVPGGDPNEFWTKELHPAGPEFTMSEDCLYLDVYTPAKKEDEKLPVYFYIHGGGLQGGYPHEIEFDWEHMARKGIVVVTPAYRLGGGVQTPGYMGHGKHYIASHKFLRAEGGIGRIVWMPKALKEQVRTKLDATAKDLYGVDDFTDMIADETVCTDDLEALMTFLAEKGHPVLEMRNIAELM